MLSLDTGSNKVLAVHYKCIFCGHILKCSNALICVSVLAYMFAFCIKLKLADAMLLHLIIVIVVAVTWLLPVQAGRVYVFVVICPGAPEGSPAVVLVLKRL